MEVSNSIDLTIEDSEPEDIPKTVLIDPWDDVYIEDINEHIYPACGKAEPTAEYFECHQCGHRTSTKDYLLRHIQNKHRALNENGHKWFYCKHCAYRGRTKAFLERHMANNCRSKWLYCEKCRYKSQKGANLKRHFDRVHKPKDGMPWLNCHQCEYRSKRSDALKKHVIAKHEKNKKFRTKSDLRAHMDKVHTVPTKLYKCNKCSREMKHQRTLNAHMRIMHGQSEIELLNCDLCDFKTKYKSAISRHMATHNGKTLQCAHCNYTTKTKPYLKKHMLIHLHKSKRH